MQLLLYDIHPSLQPYVKAICSMEDEPGVNSFHSFRILPDTCAELFINYRCTPLANIAGKTDAANNRSFAVFRMSHYMDVEMQPGTGCICVCFQPGAAHHFFKVPMNEVTDRVTAVEYLWPSSANELETRVSEATSNTDRANIIQQFLTRQVQSGKQPDKRMQYCLWQINKLKGQVSVSELSKQANISERQLGRQFSSQLGLSPKEFTKVNRFIHTLSYLKKYPNVSLTAIAYESGYYDQAHFIHDCKTYSGFTPGELATTNKVLF